MAGKQPLEEESLIHLTCNPEKFYPFFHAFCLGGRNWRPQGTLKRPLWSSSFPTEAGHHTCLRWMLPAGGSGLGPTFSL